jgi:hypothetical protein
VSAANGSWCGYCYAGRKAKQYTKGHYGYRAPKPHKTEYNAMMFKRPARVDPSTIKGLPAALDKEWSGWYPVLVEFMTATAWDDGAPRKTGTLLLFAEDGVWKACVKDRDAERVCWVSGGVLDDLLSTIDLGLREDGLAWKAEKPFKKK